MTELPRLAAPVVLCADPEPAMLAFFKKALRKLGMTPVLAHSGAECLSRIRSSGFAFEWAIIDADFKDVDSLAIMDELYARHPAVNAVLAYCSIGETERAILDRHPECALLRKPFVLDELKQILNGTL
jgi:CheY-like chemotaxis protein